MCISTLDSCTGSLRTDSALATAGWTNSWLALLIIRPRGLGLMLRIVLHQDFIGRQAGDGSEFAFGNACAERIDGPKIAVARRATRQLVGQILADNIGGGAHNFVVLL